MTNLENIVQQLYIAYYNRPAEPAGLSYWATTLQANGGNLSGIIKAFVNTPESNAIYGTNATAEARINAVYDNVFGRAPEAAGLSYWADMIKNKGLDMGEAVMFILQGAQGADAAIVNQKLSIASYYTEQMAANKLSQSDAYKMGVFDIDQVTSTSKLPAYITPVVTAPLSSATTTTTTTGGGGGGAPASPFSATESGAVTFNGSATGDISVVWSGTAGSSVATFTRAGFTAVARPDFGGAATSISLSSGQVLSDTAADLATVTISGAGNIVARASAGVQTINAAALSGGNTIDAGDGDDVINSGSGNDSLTGGAGADSINGNAGADVFIIAAAADHAVGETIVGGVDSDTIRFTSTTASETLTLRAGVTDADNLINVAISNAAGSTAGTTALNVTAAALTGTLAVNLTGNAGANTLTGTANADTITGGAGADTFVFAAGDSGTISGTVFDIVRDYVVNTGGDTLNLVGAAAAQADAAGTDVKGAITGGAGTETVTATIANGVITLAGADASAISDLTEWLAVARLMVTGDTNVGAFEFGGDTYVYQENTGGDLLIQLDNVTGITTVGVAAAANTILVA